MEIPITFLKNYTTKQYARGEVILQQDDVPLNCYAVKSGIIKSYNLTKNGEEKPVAYKFRSDVFPISWVMSLTNCAEYYYEAVKDSELYCIPALDYLRFLINNPSALLDAFQSSVKRNTEYKLRINALEHSKARHKVLYTLQFLLKLYGKNLDGMFSQIQLPLIQQDIANLIGLSRETTAIELKKLERSGVISHSQRCYFIDTDKLGQLVAEDGECSTASKAYDTVLTTVTLIDKNQNAYGKTYE